MADQAPLPMDPTAALCPLPFQYALAGWLERQHPEAWSVLAADPASEPDDLDVRLSRGAYRLDPGSHPGVHAAAGRAAAVLGVDVPVTIYQLAAGEPAGAALLGRPGEVVVLLGGNLLALLDADELCAVLGHELAHHRFGAEPRMRTAARLLDLLELDAGTPPAYLESARRFALATELVADRGALVACGDLLTAVAALVKVSTGLQDADPAAFLRQADAADPRSGSRGASHPETALRAWALRAWWDGDGAAAAELLVPALDVDALDVLDAAQLAAITRAVVEDLLADPWWRTDAVAALARQYFPDLIFLTDEPAGRPDRTAGLSARPVPDGATEATRRYLGYVLLDLVTADADLDLADACSRALDLAGRVGLAADFESVARAELQLSATAWKRAAAGGRREVPG